VTGEYVYLVHSKKEVIIEVKAAGFITQRRKLVTTDESSVLEADFALEPIDEESFHFNPIYFEEGKAELLADALSTLDSVRLLLRDNPALALRAEGHTDNRGVRKSLYELSRKRVLAVRHYLRLNGIDPKRIEIRALGPAMPIADNTLAESRARNRRVEFHLVRR
jgi:OOP family OmpA-OmpF porin